MQCRLTRADLEVSWPGGWRTLPPSLKELVEVRKVLRNGRQVDVPFWRFGAVLSFPDCFWLVRQGCAVPADQECDEAANMTALQMAAAQIAQDRLSARIESEDYDLYDAGVILGYRPDAKTDSPPGEKYLPGPNWAKYAEMRPGFYQSEDEEDE